jgi:hypothetical protein
MDVSEAFAPSRAIAHGIAALKREPLGLVLGGFLLGLSQIGSGLNGGGNFSDMKNLTPQEALAVASAMLAVGLVGMILSLIGWIFRCWFVPGWLRFQRDIAIEGAGDVATMFRGGAFGRMIGWTLLAGFVRFGTTLVALIPTFALGGFALATENESTRGVLAIAAGIAALLIAVPVAIYVSLGLVLGQYAVGLEDAGAMDALERSWELARGNRLSLLLFAVVTALVNLLGLLMCCVGAFATTPIAEFAWTESFLLATREDGHTFALMKADAAGAL